MLMSPCISVYLYNETRPLAIPKIALLIAMSTCGFHVITKTVDLIDEI